MSRDNTCRLWDIQTGNCVRVFSDHSRPVLSVAISNSGKLLASAGEDQVVKLWDLSAGKSIGSLQGHTSSVVSLAFSREDSLLCSGGLDNTVRVWSMGTLGGFSKTKAPAAGSTDRPSYVFFPARLCCCL